MDKQYTMDEYEKWLNELFKDFKSEALKEYSYLPSLSTELLVNKNKKKVGTIMRKEDNISFTYAYENWKKGKINNE